MAKKTLYAFRAENGIWRNELSEKIGIDEITLKQIEDDPEVPSDIAEKVIAAYDLAEDYFTVDPKDKRYKPRNSFKYFLKVAIAWEFLVSLIYAVVMLPITIAGVFGLGDSPLYDILGTICQELIIAFSGVYLTAYIVRKTVYGKQIIQYDYVYPYLPPMIMLCFTIVFKLSQEMLSKTTDNQQMTIIAGLAMGAVIGAIGLIIKGFITAKLLNSRLEENEKKRQKTIKIFSFLAIISFAVYSLFFIASSKVLNVAISPLNLAVVCLEFVLLICVIFGLVIGERKFPKLNKLWFTVLPLTAMLLPTLITVIGQLF